MIEIKNTYGRVIYSSEKLTPEEAAIEAVTKDADLRGADLSSANLSGGKIVSLRAYSSSLYPYQVWAVLFENGSRWVRMGCLWKSLDDWERVGIRKSNLSEFPDDGSERCEKRAAAFEFAKAAALRMKIPEAVAVEADR